MKKKQNPKTFNYMPSQDGSEDNKNEDLFNVTSYFMLVDYNILNMDLIWLKIRPNFSMNVTF